MLFIMDSYTQAPAGSSGWQDFAMPEGAPAGGTIVPRLLGAVRDLYFLLEKQRSRTSVQEHREQSLTSHLSLLQLTAAHTNAPSVKRPAKALLSSLAIS